jgi:segregation and condensation protein A
MSYKVKLDVFEGPFDLLVYLIENAEMSIYDIQVSEITSQYLEYVDQIKSLDVELAGEFMVLAAALIEIKSKMLLPRMKAEDNKELTEEDPRAELVQRILEYKEIKKGAEYLAIQEEQNSRVLTKPQEDLSYFMGSSLRFLNPNFLRNSAVVPYKIGLPIPVPLPTSSTRPLFMRPSKTLSHFIPRIASISPLVTGCL